MDRKAPRSCSTSSGGQPAVQARGAGTGRSRVGPSGGESQLPHPPVRRDRPRSDLADTVAGPARMERVAPGTLRGRHEVDRRSIRLRSFSSGFETQSASATRDSACPSTVQKHTGTAGTTRQPILDQTGLSARTIADQLGHSRISMTQDVYMGRRAVDESAAAALEASSHEATPCDGDTAQVTQFPSRAAPGGLLRSRPGHPRGRVVMQRPGSDRSHGQDLMMNPSYATHA